MKTRGRSFQLLLVAGSILLAGMRAGPTCAQQEPVQAESGRAEADTSRRVVHGAALIRSAVFPGWGQFYTGHPVKGGLMVVVQAAFIGMAARADGRVKDLVGQRSLDPVSPTLEEDVESWRSERRTWILRAFGLWLYSMADAYVDAHLYDFDEEEPQFEFSITQPVSMTGGTGMWLRLRIPLKNPER